MPSSITLVGFTNSPARSTTSSSSIISMFAKSPTRARVLAVRALSETDEPEPLVEKAKPAVEKPSRRKQAGTGFGEFQSKSSKKRSSKTDPAPESISAAAAAASSSSASPSSSPTRRRPAPSGPVIAPPSDPKRQQLETAIEITLLALVVLLIVEGLALAASGFLPEEWDNFLVKTVYPSFTPTIGLFVAAAAGYGLYKYFGSQKKS